MYVNIHERIWAKESSFFHCEEWDHDGDHSIDFRNIRKTAFFC